LALPETPALGREPFDYQASGIGTKGRASESPLGGLLGVPPAFDPGLKAPAQYGGEQFQLPSVTPMEIPEMPTMGGGFSLSGAPSLGDEDPFEYAQSGFGAQAGQRGIFGGMSYLDKGETNFLQQQPWAQEDYRLGSNISGSFPYSGMGGAHAGLMQYGQQGGVVRDDRALIDMLYRR